MAVFFSVVVPVYNGEKTVEELVDGLRNYFGEQKKSFEIVLVDDYSTDNSWALLEKLTAEDSRVIAVKLARNFGQHNATICGLEYSSGDYVITMDDDLQHAPSDIGIMFDKLEETEAKAVIAKLKNKKHLWYRRLASNLIRVLAEIAINKPKGLHLSSLRLLSRDVVKEMLRIKRGSPYVPALIFQVTQDVVNADVVHKARKYGSSNYNLSKMFKLAGQLISNNRWIVKFFGCSESAYLVEKVLNYKE